MQLSQKETMYLQDLKNQEQLCITKYTKYSSEAQAPQLKYLFQSLASKEQQHLNTINQIMSGQVPNMNQGQQGQSQGMQSSQGQGMQSSQSQSMQSSVGQQSMGSSQGGNQNQKDADLCNDMLSTEKHVSGTYDTAIFEFKDANTRQALNHIQKEEQEHGEQLFNYMQANGMYNVQ